MKYILYIVIGYFVITAFLYPDLVYGYDFKHAKEYRVVKQSGIKKISPGRTYGHWYITTAAKTHIEFAHTAMQAVMDLREVHKTDLTYVTIVPSERLIYLLDYGWAAFAADGLGGRGLSGADQKQTWAWRVRAAHRPVSAQQLEIAELWAEHMNDFPQKEAFSSLSYDSKSLREFIAGKLNICVEEAVLPTIYKTWYR